ncbi:ROK family protein [Hyphomonas sp.]|uniref:ROK family protein n=1 Tax=Hyphomonas sp. TaxID=87 RepID=UPI00391C3EEE
MSGKQRFAGVELGGTKCIALLVEGNAILDQVSVPTTSPRETLPGVNQHLTRWQAEGGFAALGIASFGPLQLNPARPDFGRMLSTPKYGWSGADVAGTLTEGLTCPWNIDTDVNGAALAEYLWGAGAGCDSLCYITIGTGIGGGLLLHGRPIHGAMHPEIGHIRTRRMPGDTFGGICPFHGDCIEGLISGPALAARFGAPAETVPDTHPTWPDVAADIAELAGTILLTTSAQRILFGGSVSAYRPFLLPMVRTRLVEQLSSYLPFLNAASAEDIIRLPALGTEAGPRGAIALARGALGA